MRISCSVAQSSLFKVNDDLLTHKLLKMMTYSPKNWKNYFKDLRHIFQTNRRPAVKFRPEMYPFKTSVFRLLAFFSRLSFVMPLKICSVKCLRPYHVETTSSRPITEVKQRRAASVLGWVTTWEYAVL